MVTATTRRQRPRRRATFVSLLGELLITAGVVALLFVAWQLWINDAIVGSARQAEAGALAEQWMAQAPSPTSAPTAEPAEPDPAAPADPAAIAVPVAAPAAHGEQFGIMYVPRFGADWQYTITGGTTREDVLDLAYIGHYTETAMPGEVGNSAYAAHRWGHGALFGPMDQLVIGDAIVVQTRDGWYTYRFRDLEYVQPTQVDVLAPVPRHPELPADERYLTLTTCSPIYVNSERLIAYAVFDSFTPIADGPPAALNGGV